MFPQTSSAPCENGPATVCEYCRLPQSCQEATFHIDHVVPRDAGGETSLDNLALACVTCSLKKAARTQAVDDQSGEQASIFSHRGQTWDEHFGWTVDWHAQGLTPTGRAAAEALGMNRPAIIAIRELLADAGRFPDDPAASEHSAGGEMA
ncbi:MAG: HNH endonuclease [Pirellulaceae bacterium]